MQLHFHLPAEKHSACYNYVQEVIAHIPSGTLFMRMLGEPNFLHFVKISLFEK
jgi:hypothetical protein